MRSPISVILPVYNEGLYISECLESIISEKGESVEICVSDNASTDNTWDIVREFQQRNSTIKAVRQGATVHPFENIKHAFSLASGSHVILMGGDDYFLSGTFSAAMRAYAELPDLRAFVLNANYFDDSSRTVFASFPPSHFRQAINGSRRHLIKFVIGHINHDELGLAVFRRCDFEKALSLVHQTSIESVALWIFLSVALLNGDKFPQISISESANLMKRYGKPSDHDSKYTTWANKMEQSWSTWNSIDRLFQFQKMFGSITTIAHLKSAGVIDWREMMLLLVSSRHHSEYGLCFLAPIFHPFWRMWRAVAKLTANAHRH
jgi:glycosyltransferase involved in cell wall biosynthesis